MTAHGKASFPGTWVPPLSVTGLEVIRDTLAALTEGSTPAGTREDARLYLNILKPVELDACNAVIEAALCYPGSFPGRLYRDLSEIHGVLLEKLGKTPARP